LYPSPYIFRIIKEDEMNGHVACMIEVRNALKMLLGKDEGKRPLQRSGHI
jgi:hypothetical protein